MRRAQLPLTAAVLSFSYIPPLILYGHNVDCFTGFVNFEDCNIIIYE